MTHAQRLVNDRDRGPWLLRRMQPRTYIVTVRYVPPAQERVIDPSAPARPREPVTTIVCVRTVRPPSGEDHVPRGGTFSSSDILPESRLDDMPAAVRPRYVSQYRHYLLWRRTKAFGCTVADLVAGVHFDPQDIDARVRAWVGAS